MIDGGSGIAFTGNVLQMDRDDGGVGVWSPSFGIVYGGLSNCVIANNTLHEAAKHQLLVDLGRHGEGVIVRDNPGSLKASS